MRALRSWLGFLGTLALAGLPARAGAQPVGSEFQVNTYTYSHQRVDSVGGHLVAADASGNFVVVWRSVQDGSYYGIFGQRYDSAGVALGSEFRVNSYTTNRQRYSSVAAAADGNFVVVWDSKGQDGSDYGIFGQRYDSAGGPLGSEFRVNSYTTNKQAYPSVASDASGNFVVVWSSSSQDGGYNLWGVFGQRYDSSGTALGDEFRVNSYTTNHQVFPSVASDASGNFVVVWNSRYQDGSGYGIFGQRYDSAGVPLGDEFQINTFTTGYQRLSSVTSDASGNFVVVWGSNFQDGSSSGIFGQRYDGAGVAQGSEFRVNSYTTGEQAGPSVASDVNGSFVVAWTGVDGNGFGVLGQRYDSAGVAQGDEFQINSYTTGHQGGTVVGATGASQFVAVWGSFGQDGSLFGVFGQRFALDTTPPDVAMSSAAPDPTNTSPIPVIVQFSEDVSGFTDTDIVAGNATVGTFVPVDGDTYTFELTPSGQGLVTADIAAGVAQDGASNGNTAATQFSRTFDSVAPTVAVSSAAPDPTNTSPIPVTAQFSEDVTGFTDTDIVAGNASVGNFVAVDGDTYTFDLTPSGQGSVTADIAAGVAQDGASNGNTAATQFSRTFDSVAPTVAMSSAAPNPTNTSPIPVTAQFSENVTDFTGTDIVAGNATVGNFVAVDGDTYTFHLTPIGQGLVTADIAAGVAQDAAGNGNTAAPQFSRIFDSVAPTVTINQPNGGEKLFTGSSYAIQWTASDGTALASFDVLVSVNGGGSFAPIAECQNLSGSATSCLWLAPGPPSVNALVRVAAEDTSGNSASDDSNAVFTIVSGTASVTVASPNTNLRWRIGSIQPIKWTHNLGLNSSVRIELDRTNDGTYEELIAAAAPATTATKGVFNWTVTGPPSATARVRISWTGNLAVSDTSNVTFQIRP